LKQFIDRTMPVLKRTMKLGLATLALAAMLVWTPLEANAATGSIRITITRAQFVVGGGGGTLRLLRVGGVSAGPFGAARVDLVGRAYNMRTAANIHGIYATIAETGQPGTFRLRNWQGVVLELRGRQGIKPSVDLNGLQISLR
jgi:hypothetical protein